MALSHRSRNCLVGPGCPKTQLRGMVRSQNQGMGSKSDTLAVFVAGGEGRIEMRSGGLFE